MRIRNYTEQEVRALTTKELCATVEYYYPGTADMMPYVNIRRWAREELAARALEGRK